MISRLGFILQIWWILSPKGPVLVPTFGSLAPRFPSRFCLKTNIVCQAGHQEIFFCRCTLSWSAILRSPTITWLLRPSLTRPGSTGSRWSAWQLACPSTPTRSAASACYGTSHISPADESRCSSELDTRHCVLGGTGTDQKSLGWFN